MNQRFSVQGLQAPDGMALRAGRWEVGAAGTAPRAVCVLLQGLGEFLEKYDEVAEELNARGFIVISVDWRSQGASERSGRDNRLAHVASFEEYEQDLAILIQKLALPTELPLIALAHSTGAHILLRYLAENKRRIACAALVSPLIDIVIEKYPHWAVRLLTALANFPRPSRRPLPGTDEHDQLYVPFENNRVTSDRARYAQLQEKLKKQPFLRINGPSFGWLRAAFRSIRQVSTKAFAEEIATPLIVYGAGKDRIVKTDRTREYVEWIPKARYVELEEAEHEILMENDSIRNRFWNAFDAFVEKQLAEPRSGFFAARGGDER